MIPVLGFAQSKVEMRFKMRFNELRDTMLDIAEVVEKYPECLKENVFDIMAESAFGNRQPVETSYRPKEPVYHQAEPVYRPAEPVSSMDNPRTLGDGNELKIIN